MFQNCILEKYKILIVKANLNFSGIVFKMRLFVNSFLYDKNISELFLDNGRVLKIGEGKKYIKKLFQKTKVEGQRTVDSVSGLKER